MDKKQIEGQLKLSKKQNEDERSDYLCSQFNCVDYLIKLEKYTNNLLRKNKKQKEIINNVINIINQHFKHHPELFTENQIEYDLIRKIENILKEV